MINSFLDIRFPDYISFNSKGGPQFSTLINTSYHGGETRIVNWFHERAKYNVLTGIKTKNQAWEVLKLFRICRGRATAFRFKDWLDFEARGQQIGVGDGINREYDFIKKYDISGRSYERKIQYVIPNSEKLYLDDVLLSSDMYEITDCHKVKFLIPPAANKLITTDFEFDVIVRFDADELSISVDDYESSNLEEISLVEVKIF